MFTVNLERRTITPHYEGEKEYDLEVYGKITAETDLHSEPEIKAEIGFKKKF